MHRNLADAFNAFLKARILKDKEISEVYGIETKACCIACPKVRQ